MAYNAEAHRRYRQSAKGRARRNATDRVRSATPAAKASKRRYNRSEATRSRDRARKKTPAERARRAGRQRELLGMYKTIGLGDLSLAILGKARYPRGKKTIQLF